MSRPPYAAWTGTQRGPLSRSLGEARVERAAKVVLERGGLPDAGHLERGRLRIELRSLLGLAAPIMIAQLANTAMGFVDTVMAGAPKFGVVAAFLAQHNGGVVGRAADEPVSTLTTGGSFGQSQQAVVAAHMMRQFGTSVGHDLDEPAHTDTATVNKSALISGFLTKYYGTGDGAAVDVPLHTDTTKDRFGLVTVDIDGQTFAIADIGMRMLTPRERFRAQGFPESYIIDRRPDGSPITMTVQGSCCGNSVPPPISEALVAANCGHLAARREAAE